MEIIESWVKNSKEGNAKYFTEMLERTEGKVPDKVETKGSIKIELICYDPKKLSTSKKE